MNTHEFIVALISAGKFNAVCVVTAVGIAGMTIGFTYAYMFTTSMPLWFIMALMFYTNFSATTVVPMLTEHTVNWLTKQQSAIIDDLRAKISLRDAEIDLLKRKLIIAGKTERDLNRQLFDPVYFANVVNGIIVEEPDDDESSDESMPDLEPVLPRAEEHETLRERGRE